MLRLAILRHAKSSWDEAALDDFDRPLNARGRKAAPEMARRLAASAFAPDLVLCSPALRTRQTLDLVVAERPSQTHDTARPEIRYPADLYLASAVDMLNLLRNSGGTHERVLLIGHNPGVHSLALMLTGKGSFDATERLMEKFPTAGLALLTFDIAAWRDLQPASGHLDAFMTPKRDATP
ncbi:MAG: SixA phosphatase family protein [Hyphomicrobium sp.]